MIPRRSSTSCGTTSPTSPITSRKCEADVRGLWRPLRIGFVVAILLASAYGGLVDGWRSFGGAVSIGQRIAAATQLMYGTLSVACLVALVAARRLVRTLLVLWGIEVTLTAAMASVVWGGTSILVGAVAGLSVALVVALVLWAWRVEERAALTGHP